MSVPGPTLSSAVWGLCPKARWSGRGCTFVGYANSSSSDQEGGGKVGMCNCTHLTAFSVLLETADQVRERYRHPPYLGLI